MCEEGPDSPDSRGFMTGFLHSETPASVEAVCSRYRSGWRPLRLMEDVDCCLDGDMYPQR